MRVRTAGWLWAGVLGAGGMLACDDGGTSNAGGDADAAEPGDARLDGSMPPGDGAAGDAAEPDADAEMDAETASDADDVSDAATDGTARDEAAVDAAPDGDMDAMSNADADADASPDAPMDAPEDDADAGDAETGEQDAEAGTDGSVPEVCQPVTFEVTAPSAASYAIGGELDPTLTLCRGVTYTFELDAPGHPFYIKTEAGNADTDGTFDEGVSGAGTQSGTVTFAVPQAAPDTLHYQCSAHAGMTGVLDVIDP